MRRKLSYFFLFAVGIVGVLSARATPTCACLTYEVLDMKGYRFGSGDSFDNSFFCEGRIQLKKNRLREPSVWQRYYYRDQLALAKRGCLGLESFDREVH